MTWASAPSEIGACAEFWAAAQHGIWQVPGARLGTREALPRCLWVWNKTCSCLPMNRALKLHPVEYPWPWRELELDLHVSNQDMKTDGNKMPALIQKACGGKIKWEERMNVFSAELCASSRARFVRSRLNQPDASWQKAGYDRSPGAGKTASIFLSTATRDRISTESQAGPVSFDLFGNVHNNVCHCWCCEIPLAGSLQVWVLWMKHFLGPEWIW